MGACQQSDAKMNRELTHLNVVDSLYLCAFGINIATIYPNSIGHNPYVIFLIALLHIIQAS